jgi:hopanoid biosynthesis associated protein HpnK
MLAKCADGFFTRIARIVPLQALIVNADDFGLSAEVNAGIARAHREGVLTSASLMVAEPGAKAAADFARDNPLLDVGLHAVVCKGRSVLDASRLAGAVDARGNFIDSPVLAGMRYFFDRSLRAAMRDEMRAQIDLHLKMIGYLNHIDGHLNFHVHPLFADILIDLAIEYHVPCLRLPREPVLTTLRLRRDNAPRKIVEAAIFRLLSGRARRKMKQRGLKSTDWLFGLHQSGHLDQDYVLNVIDRLPDGITELYFHPADAIGDLAPARAARLEVEILTSPGIRHLIDRRGIRLITFSDLAKLAPAA